MQPRSLARHSNPNVNRTGLVQHSPTLTRSRSSIWVAVVVLRESDRDLGQGQVRLHRAQRHRHRPQRRQLQSFLCEVTRKVDCGG